MSKIKNVLIAGLLVASLTPSIASAAEKNFAEIFTDCGLGGIVGQIADGPTGNILAVVTNVTWDLGTTATSSALSSPDSCSNNTALTANLINQGYNEIEKELALGNGKYVQALASLNKSASQTDAEYISSLRTDFSAIVASNEYTTSSHFEKSEKLFNKATK